MKIISDINNLMVAVGSNPDPVHPR